MLVTTGPSLQPPSRLYFLEQFYVQRKLSLWALELLGRLPPSRLVFPVWLILATEEVTCILLRAALSQELH